MQSRNLFLASKLAITIGLCLGLNAVVSSAADTVVVIEVVSTYQTHLDDGRIELLSDGKSDTGIPWEFNRGKIDFGRNGEAEPRAGGTYYKGHWIGGWQLCGRVLMNNTSLQSEPAKAAVMPETAGESFAGTEPSSDLKESIVDLWEFVAVVPRTNKFIRLTCDFTSDNLVLDGDRKIGTYEVVSNTTLKIDFVDPKFGQLEFKEKRDKTFSARTKAVKRVYWDLKLVRVQRQAVYQSEDGDLFVLYTNNRVNSPRYTKDYWTTWDWYYFVEKGKRHLAFRDGVVKLSAGGRQIEWGRNKMVLVQGFPPR